MTAKIDVTPHLENLWRYGRVLTRDDADADDLVQEALARALSLAHTYDHSRPLLPWLIRIVRNTFLTGVNRAKASRRRLETYAVLSNQSADPPQEYQAELANVQSALANLSAEHVEILHVIGVLGFSYADAAAVLGVPTGTVMSRLSRARSALRESMECAKSFGQPRLRIVGGRRENG